jgi:radical SAM protein with 4Fe4S-binding SPASM domain
MDTTDFKAYGYPYMLQIEPTNICNLSCPLCPAGRSELNRPRRHMTLEEFKGIIDDMERWLLLTVLWDWGEPFTNPQLAEMIRYATQRRIATVTSTNAQFLNDETRVKAILESGLSTLIVAIDSVCEASYEAYRKRGDLDKALGGLQRLVQMKRRLDSKTKINLRTIVMRQNEQELDQIREVARRIGVDVFTVKSVNPTCGTTAHDAEMVPLNPKYRRYQYKEGTFERIRVDAAVCRQVWSTANIHSNGNVVPCCYHYDDELAVGNVFKQPFSELWNGPAYRALRKRIYQDKDSIPRCRECWINYKLSESGWFVESTRFKR